MFWGKRKLELSGLYPFNISANLRIPLYNKYFWQLVIGINHFTCHLKIYCLLLLGIGYLLTFILEMFVFQWQASIFSKG